MRAKRFLPVVLGVLVASAGCKKPREVVLTKEQQEQIDEAVLEEAPEPDHEVGAVLDDQVRLIGVDLSDERVSQGDEIEVTWYWEALADIGDQWKIFVHLEAPGKKRTVHDHQPVGELYPLGRWKKGQIIEDSQTIEIDSKFPPGTAKLYTGIYDEQAWTEKQQNVRMEVTNQDELDAPVTGDQRIEAASMTVVAEGESGEEPPSADVQDRSYTAHRIREAPSIDGKLDEGAWQRVPTTKAFVDPEGGAIDSAERTRARALWDDDHLYLGMSARDDDLTNEVTERDGKLWEQDVLEFYADPDGDGKNYVELQVSPTGTVFDARFDERRSPEWKKAAERYDIEGLEAEVHTVGSVNARDDGKSDERWSIEVAIPWRALPSVEGPPEEGTSWTVNFYRIEAGSPDGDGFMAAWSPAGQDFHNLERFGELRFRKVGPGGEGSRRVKHLDEAGRRLEAVKKAGAASDDEDEGSEGSGGEGSEGEASGGEGSESDEDEGSGSSGPSPSE